MNTQGKSQKPKPERKNTWKKHPENHLPYVLPNQAASFKNDKQVSRLATDT